MRNVSRQHEMYRDLSECALRAQGMDLCALLTAIMGGGTQYRALPDDTGQYVDYCSIMEYRQPHIILTLDTSQPIELADFVSSFTALAAQYEKYMKAHHPAESSDAKIYVKEVRTGSFVAELLPIVMAGGNLAANVIYGMDAIKVVDDFIREYGARLGKYLGGGKDSSATKSDLSELIGQVSAIARDPEASAIIQSVHYDDAERKVSASLHFDTKAARAITDNARIHRNLLDHKSAAECTKVLMTFSQSNVKNTGMGKRTGERAVINSVTSRDLPLIYVSDMAEKNIKHEIREGEDNIFRKGFIVDVDVECRDNGLPVAYRIKGFHGVIDIDE